MVNSSSYCLRYEPVTYPCFCLLCIKMGSTVYLTTSCVRHIKLYEMFLNLIKSLKFWTCLHHKYDIQPFILPQFDKLTRKQKLSTLYWDLVTQRSLCGSYFNRNGWIANYLKRSKDCFRYFSYDHVVEIMVPK